jgi:HD-GYP domain-containing protein (c-di-GMP phosphodiesterase class II)
MIMNRLFTFIRGATSSLVRIFKPLQLGSFRRERRRNANSRGALLNNSSPNGIAGRNFSKMTRQETMAELQKAAEESRDFFVEALRELAAASDSRDPYTRGHSERVTRFSVEIAKTMGLPTEEIERIRIGALIHDIGKITIDDDILNKPTVLTKTEYEVMKTHTIGGYELLEHIPQLEDITPGLLYHHELLDGNGYPYGLKGAEIPMIARVITVADCFDAMTTIRPYQEPAPIDYVLGMIRSAAGIKYDQQVVEALVRAVRTGRIVTRLKDRAPQ